MVCYLILSETETQKIIEQWENKDPRLIGVNAFDELRPVKTDELAAVYEQAIRNCGFVISQCRIAELLEVDFSGSDHVFLYFKENAVSIKDARILLELREKYVKEKNWISAKGINDVLLDIDFLNRNIRQNGLPNYFQVETSSVCNAECVMCKHYYCKNDGAAFLKTDTLRKAEDVLPCCRYVALNGMGEPLISPYLLEHMEIYDRYNVSVSTNTNLSVLKDELLPWINKVFDSVEISCDGASKRTYEYIRKNLSYDVLLSNIDKLKQHCPDLPKRLAVVIMRQNVCEMPDLVKLAARAGAHIIAFVNLGTDIVLQNEKDSMLNYPAVLNHYIELAKKQGEIEGITVVAPEINPNGKAENFERELQEMRQSPLYIDAERRERIMHLGNVVGEYISHNSILEKEIVQSKAKCSGICDWLLQRSFMDLEGNITPCCTALSFHMGNINKVRNFEQIWNGEMYQKMRECFYSGYLPETCLNCGLIESHKVKYLKVYFDHNFYSEAAYKKRRKEILKSLIETGGTI